MAKPLKVFARLSLNKFNKKMKGDLFGLIILILNFHCILASGTTKNEALRSCHWRVNLLSHQENFQIKKSLTEPNNTVFIKNESLRIKIEETYLNELKNITEFFSTKKQLISQEQKLIWDFGLSKIRTGEYQGAVGYLYNNRDETQSSVLLAESIESLLIAESLISPKPEFISVAPEESKATTYLLEAFQKTLNEGSWGSYPPLTQKGLIEGAVLLAAGRYQNAIWHLIRSSADGERVAECLEQVILNSFSQDPYTILGPQFSNRSSKAVWVEFASGLVALRKSSGRLNSTTKEVASYQLDRDLRFNVYPVSVLRENYSFKLMIPHHFEPENDPVRHLSRDDRGVSEMNLFLWLTKSVDIDARNFFLLKDYNGDLIWVVHDQGLSFDHNPRNLEATMRWNYRFISPLVQKKVRGYSSEKVQASLGSTYLTPKELRELDLKIIEVKKHI